MTSLAHGVGSRHDLPISPFYAYAGAFVALFVSFLALGLLWSRSRFRGDEAGRPLPELLRRPAEARSTRLLLRAAGAAAAVFVALHLLLGPDDPDRNPAPGAVYVLFWVGLVPASLLLGPVWRLLNPLRTAHALLCRVRRRPPAAACRPLPPRLGHWPAAAGLFAFTWLELASPEPASATGLLVFLTLYGAFHLAGAAFYGERWFAACDAFEVYSALLGRLSPLGRRSDGVLVVRDPFDGLDGTLPVPGLLATVCVMLGSTAYDGYADDPSWITTVQTSSLGRTTTATLGLLSAVVLVAALYAVCAGAARLIAGPVPRPLTAFAHSLVPVAAGYLVAHYFSLLVTEGPRTVVMAASGTGGAAAPEPVLSPGGIAVLQVTAVVVGHVLGVVAAHDRSVRLLPAHRAVAGQLPLLALMVGYTVGGIGLLLA